MVSSVARRWPRRASSASGTASHRGLGQPRLRGGRRTGPTCEDRGVLLGLRLQRTRETGGLGQRGVEQVDGLAERGQHRAGQLAHEDLARLEVGQLGDLRRVESLAVDVATLDHEGGVRLGKVTQTLRRLDHVAGDEGDSGRADEQVVEAGDARLLGGELGQRVLDHGVVGVLAERAPQVLQLLHGETAVLGQHGTRGILERLHDLRDGGCLVWPRHGSPSGGDRRSAIPGKDERPEHRLRAWIRRCAAPADRSSVTCAGRPPLGGTFGLACSRGSATTGGLWLRPTTVRRARGCGQIAVGTGQSRRSPSGTIFAPFAS